MDTWGAESIYRAGVDQFVGPTSLVANRLMSRHRFGVGSSGEIELEADWRKRWGGELAVRLFSENS